MTGPSAGGVRGVAVQADIWPDTHIQILPPIKGTQTQVLVVGEPYQGHVALYGTAGDLRRLAATILAALPEEETS